jgi:hypothetical protein
MRIGIAVFFWGGGATEKFDFIPDSAHTGYETDPPCCEMGAGDRAAKTEGGHPRLFTVKN